MDKLFVKRANVVLEVEPDEKDYYMSMGYSVIDEDGKVLEQALPNDVNALKIMVRQLQEEIATLKKSAEKPKTTTKKVEK